MSPSESNAKTAQSTIAAMEKRIKELEAERAALIVVAIAADGCLGMFTVSDELEDALSNLPKGIL